jgi:hypothetical protein
LRLFKVFALILPKARNLSPTQSKTLQKTSRSDYRCKCPIWVSGTLTSGERVRKTLKGRDWNRAQEIVRKWDVDGHAPKNIPRVTIEVWRDRFLEDGKARNLRDNTLKLYRLLFRQLLEFTSGRGFHYVNELDLTALTDFRASWVNNLLSAMTKLERLRGIYKFAVQRKFVDENFASLLAPPKVKPNPTLPFSADEMKRIRL